MPTPFAELAGLSLTLRQTPKRLAAMERIGAFLAHLPSSEVRAATLLLLGRALPKGDPRTLEVSGATLWRAVRALAHRQAPSAPGARPSTNAAAPRSITEDAGVAARALLAEEGGHIFPESATLTLQDVSDALISLAEIRGKGAAARREALLVDLLGRATADELEVIVRIVLGDMRQGADEGVVLEAVARRPDIGQARITRAKMLLGDASRVVEIACTEGAAGLDGVRLEPFRPLAPMLAQKAETATDALALCGGRAVLEHKLDGARLQIHIHDGKVRLFTRRLSEVTESLSDVCAAVREALPLNDAIVEGEVVPVDRSGRPLPFQDLMRRFRRVHSVDERAAEIGTRVYLFDLLAMNGDPLLDTPQCERWSRLVAALSPTPSVVLVPRLETTDDAAATAFTLDAIDRGYEGVMAKNPTSPYSPGVRGRAWLKIKKVHTLDVVVVAADWGYGRRNGWLSNYHLAVRDDNGDFTEVGKTFKGLSDAEFEQLTARLLGLRDGPAEAPTVRVRPSVVLEVAFSDVQASPTYPCGYALRFARVVRIRDDKTADEIDTVARVREQFERQQSAAF